MTDPRVALAAERTLLAWIRTGLAMMGFGFVVARFGLFLHEIAAAEGRALHPSGFSLWIGVALVLLGVVVTLLAAREHVSLHRRLDADTSMMRAGTTSDPTVRSVLGVWVALALALIGIGMAVYLVVIG